jgi:hypothetical protein
MAGFATASTEPRIWQYVLAALVALYFLAPAQLPWIPVSAQGALVALVFFAHLVDRRGRIDLTLLVPLALFFGPLVLAMVFAPGGYVVEYVRPLILGGIASYLFAFYFRDLRSLRSSGIMLILLLPSAVFSIAFFLVPELIDGVPPSLRLLAWGVLGDAILYGLFLIVGHLALVHAYVRARGHLLLAPVLVTTLALIATGSRGIWLGTLVGTGLCLVLSRRGRRGAVVLIMMALTFWGFRTLMQARVDGYVESGGNLAAAPRAVEFALTIKVKGALSEKNRQDALLDRWVIVVTGLRIWRRFPLLGAGPGTFAQRAGEFLPAARGPVLPAEDTPVDPHNIYIAILTDAGAVGMAGFLGMLGLIMVRAWRRRQRGEGEPALNVLMASVIALSAVGLVHDVHLDRLWWIMLGLLNGQSTPPRFRRHSIVSRDRADGPG